MRFTRLVASRRSATDEDLAKLICGFCDFARSTVCFAVRPPRWPASCLQGFLLGKTKNSAENSRIDDEDLDKLERTNIAKR